MRRMGHGLGRSCRGGNALGSFGHRPVAIEQFDFNRQRLARDFQMLQETIHVQRRLRSEHVLGPGKYVLDKSSRNNAKSYFAVNASKSEVVDFVTKGRDVGALAGVDIDRKDVLAFKVEVRSEFEGEGCVPSFIFSQPYCVEPNCRGSHDSFKVNEHSLPTRFLRHPETAPINRNELIFLLVKSMPRQANIGVRNDYAFKVRIVEILRVPRFRQLLTVPPVPIHRKDQPSLLVGILCSVSKDMRHETGTSNQCAGSLNEIASIHSVVILSDASA